MLYEKAGWASHGEQVRKQPSFMAFPQFLPLGSCTDFPS